MGSLGVGGEAAVTEPAAEPAAEPEDQRAGDDAGDDGDEPARPLSRREEATRRAVADEMAKFQQKYDARLSQSQQQYQQEISRVQQENARLAGQLDTWQRQSQQPAAPTTPREDPAELKRQARAALDANKFDEYERLTERAADVRDAARWEERQQQLTQRIQQQIPQQMNPLIAGLLAKHDHVAMAGARGEAMVTNKAQALQIAGWQPGPALVTKAFELTNEELKAATAANAAAVPRYDTASAAALAGVPGGRQPAAGGGGEAGSGGTVAPKLNDLEESVRKTSKMSVEEYNAWKKDPEAAARKKWRK